ncbi:MAG TPA: Uma2 family endonuclease [Gemmataceae bacterium]|nr:Uma2 family endonuclease [Gemmataceae bacterium]
MSVAQLLKPEFTVDEYLALERASDQRLIYLDGEIFAMAGESGEHADITSNIVITLGNQLKGKPCRVRSKDTKVRSGIMPMSGLSVRGMFSYPDIVVICGEPEYHDAHEDVVINPKVIVETLSESTEAFDRGEKFERYKTWNPTLSDYLLVSQTSYEIQHSSRQADGTWLTRVYKGLDAKVEIASIDCVLRLADIYDRVKIAAS